MAAVARASQYSRIARSRIRAARIKVTQLAAKLLVGDGRFSLVPRLRERERRSLSIPNCIRELYPRDYPSAVLQT
jgi:hypothetical protein